ncbi:tRNA lysidine(34) synthetase TilS [Peptococcaceae bacterium 1198_IL3148]
MDIAERVYNYILSHRLIVPGDVVLVAVSGGADSLTLLHILVVLKEKLNISLHVAHLDHMLRGQESQRDAEFVRMFCNQRQIPCTVEARNVSLYQQQNRLSSETAAREVRYRFLNEVAQSCHANRIALGHHADDQAETVLLNLLRGAGITGMAGIAPQRDNKYIRPLLTIRRYEIEQYCQKNELNFCTDSTNKSTIYLRNKLRLSLIPLLQREYNEEIVAILGRLAELSRAEDDFIALQAREIFSSIICCPQKGVIEVAVEEFNRQHIALQRRLIRMIWAQLTGGYRDLAYHHVESILRQCQKSKPGGIELPGGMVCRIAYGKMIFSPVSGELTVPSVNYPLTIPGQTEVQELGITIEAQIYNVQEKAIDPRKLPSNEAVFDYGETGNDLYVRNRRPGDKFNPQGAGGMVKLKKFLIDQKVPREKRQLVPLICSKDKIIWVSGLRVGEYWKITKRTKQILHLKVKNIVG